MSYHGVNVHYSKFTSLHHSNLVVLFFQAIPLAWKSDFDILSAHVV